MTISATTQGLRMGVATSSSRPTVPFTGQVISETDTGVLKVYNGTSWVTVGPPTAATSTYTNGQQSTSSTSYVGLTTGTAVTVTTGTSALVVVTVRLAGDTVNAENLVSYAVSGATTIAAADTNSSSFANSNTAIYSGATVPLFVVQTGLTAGSNTFTIQYRTSAGLVYVNNRRITVFPL